MAQVCGQHARAQRIGRKLELCMPINEARRRSLESRGACTLSSDRCNETRHELETRPPKHFPRLSRALSLPVKRPLFPPIVQTFSGQHSCSAVLCANIQIPLLFFFFSLRLTRGLPAQQASAAASSPQPALPHRHLPRIQSYRQRQTQSKVEHFDFTMMAPTASS